MINKQNLWFITLFSLILVLSIYYVTMPDSLLKNIETENKSEEKTAQVVEEVKESETLTALRVADDEETLKAMNALQEILLDDNKSNEEKSKAYDSLKELNLNKGKEQGIEQKIEETYSLKSFVKIKNDQIKVVISSTKHDPTLANNVIRTVQENFDKQMYITVKFDK